VLQALDRVSQALDRVSQALDRVSQALDRVSQALDQVLTWSIHRSRMHRHDQPISNQQLEYPRSKATNYNKHKV